MALTRSLRDTVAEQVEGVPECRAALTEGVAAQPRRLAQTSLTVALDVVQADRFRAWARVKGGVSAALRQLVGDALGDGPPTPRPGPGTGRQIGVRLRQDEQVALASAAVARGMTPSGWLRALACAHLLRRPRWGDAELDALRGAEQQLRMIRFEVNQVAAALAAATQAHPSQARPQRQQAAAEAVAVARDVPALVEIQLRRLEGLVRGNLDDWGVLPDEQAKPEPK